MSIHQMAAFADTATQLHPLVFPSAQVQPISLYGGDSEIYGQGEQAGALYQIEFGAVRLYRLLADGRRQISAFHLAGEVFGFESGDTHHFFAEAICATSLRVIRPAHGADLSRQLLPLALKGLVRAQEHLLVLGRQSALERVAAFMLDMAERQGGLETFDLPMSRTDIGDYLGLTIETVSRIISQLRARGIIRLKTLRTVELLKPNALRDISE